MVIDPRDVRDWIASIAEIGPDQNPVDALFDALLPNVDDELEVEAYFVDNWSAARFIVGGRTIDLPREASRFLMPLLDLCSTQERSLPQLLVQRTRTGYRVKRVKL